MPELPDVEYYRRYFESTSLHQTIAKVTVNSNQILDGVTADIVADQLKGKFFHRCTRYGKYLFSQASVDLWLVLHFGMTGNLVYYKDAADAPPYQRLTVNFSNGNSLAFSDQRKFGKVSLTSNQQDFVLRKRLGPDALEVDFPTFKTVAEVSRGTAKSTLLNQHIIAGVGNIYADEILYQAGIHPQTKTSQLNEETIKRLFNALKQVLKTAIDLQADPTALPENYLIHYRFSGADCPGGCGKVATAKVAGRTTYFCPECQKFSS